MTLNKTFILNQFGTPHPWTQQFIDAVQPLAPYGYRWLIFTPNKLESKGNVTVIPQTIEEFNALCESKLGVNPRMFITESGVPSVHVTDFCVFYGLIYQDYLNETDYWGMCGWDTLMGRLDHFLPDDLWGADVFSDDIEGAVNGTFCLFKNAEKINKLCLEIPHYKAQLLQNACKRCTGELGKDHPHTLAGTDEYAMTQVCMNASREGRIRYICPLDYAMHSHDRLIQHCDGVNLLLRDDGRLFELFKDMRPPEWVHKRPFMGREIPYFHFMVTKAWPIKP